MKQTICQCCGQTIKARKIDTSTPVDTATLTDTQLYAYYKRTAPFEDIAFWIARAQMSDALRARFVALADTGNAQRIKRKLPSLQAQWRRESNAREFQAHLDAGDVLVGEHWTQAVNAELSEVA